MSPMRLRVFLLEPCKVQEKGGSEGGEGERERGNRREELKE